MTSTFDYATAFARNRGFLTRAEQARLRQARVAIAGLGGTGGAQVQALARMGIGRFTIADPDTFELVNFNRQAGAFMSTLGHRKTEVAERFILDINPEAEVRRFDEGIDAQNIDAFLEGADVVIDSLDFYCFEERLVLYPRAREEGLWVLTAPPLGFGFTLLCFDPKGMTFEDYFDFRPEMAETERIAALVAGIAPYAWFNRYLHWEDIDAGKGRLPSVGAAPFLIAGAVATEVTKLLTAKPVRAVPAVQQFDALLGRLRVKSHPWGMRAPWQRLRRLLLARAIKGRPPVRGGCPERLS